MSQSVGGGSFRPHKERGVWANSHDFAWACLNNAFRIDNIDGIGIIPMIVTYGFFPVVSWFFIALLYAVPLFFIQSFLGQFSSSGYISAFRISPLFKSLGYLALAMNLISLAFHSVLVAVPLLFLIHSLQPSLPWSCDAPHSWDKSTWDKTDMYTRHCNLSRSANMDYTLLAVSSTDFFRYKVNNYNFEVIGCVLLVWAALAFVTYQSSEKIGIIFRYCTMIMVTLLVIVFLRMLFLPGVLDHMGLPKPYHSSKWWLVCIFHVTFMGIGPGWGSVLSLASYNKFKTDVVKYSWQIPICQFVILILFSLLRDFAEVHLTQDNDRIFPTSLMLPWMGLLSIPSTLASIELPHLWTWMFLIMTILGAFNLTLTLVFSTQTALLDEFERLRPFKKEIVIAGAAVLGLFSALFCTMNGLRIIGMMFNVNVFTQCFINLILILVVLWAYGHERLKRDVEFMTNELLSSWKLYYIRFVTPILFGLTALFTFVFYMHDMRTHLEIGIVCVMILPWIALFLFCVYRLSQESGACRLRLSRCTKPTDWYPVDGEDKQRYDEMFGNQEASAELTTMMP